MKSIILLGIVIAGALAQTGPISSRVIVCMEAALDPRVPAVAQQEAAQIFASIGVQLEFRGFYACPNDSPKPILVRFQQHTDPRLDPGALGKAEPFGNASILIFYDRVTATTDRQLIPVVLGHVLAHELGHVLGRSNWHSNSGVMKARWDRRDLSAMQQHPLTFTEADISQIFNGMARITDSKSLIKTQDLFMRTLDINSHSSGTVEIYRRPKSRLEAN